MTWLHVCFADKADVICESHIIYQTQQQNRREMEDVFLYSCGALWIDVFLLCVE